MKSFVPPCNCQNPGASVTQTGRFSFKQYIIAQVPVVDIVPADSGGDSHLVFLILVYSPLAGTDQTQVEKVADGLQKRMQTGAG